MTKPVKLRVGIIGASGAPGATTSWAINAHLPALRALSDTYAVVAASTTRRETADETARRFGIPHAFDRPEPLIEHPDVDLVVVSVRAPDHAALVRAAIDAGKHVLCEWPLGATLAETTELTERAARAGVRTAIGLQRRLAPGVRHVRQLIAEGYLGALRSVTLQVALPMLGAVRPAAWAYTADIASGVNALHTVTAHFLDTALAATAPLASFTGLVVRQLERTTLAETGASIPVTAPDQIAITGTLEGGAVLSVRVEAGKRSGGGISWTLTGSDGDLAVAPDYSLTGSRSDAPLAPIATPDALSWLPKGELSDDAHQVAHLYTAFARDLPEGTAVAPTFTDALALHRLLEQVAESSQTGRRLAPAAVPPGGSRP